MKHENSQEFHRKSIRLENYDYSQPGAYFVTIVAQSRKCLFGRVENGEMILNDAGKMIEQVCHEIEMDSDWINIGPIQVMPNHLHLIINLGLQVFIDDSSTERRKPSTSVGLDEFIDRPSLFVVIGRIKSITTCRYIEGVGKKQWPKFSARMWQRSYYDHVIRDERDYEVVSEYIESNPMNWDNDEENNSF
jgi:REP element-mobilizing transposase RayT